MKIPYGYRIIRGQALPEPRQAAHLEAFFRLYLSGASIRAAAAGAGIPHAVATCRRMLTNPAYGGDGYYPRLLPEALLAAARRETARRAEKLLGKTGRRRRRPQPVGVRFTVGNPPPPAGDPAEYAAALYACIRPDVS